ncbi:MAG: ABC transporter substrate-binding protein [Thiotrichales bacterium]|nr:ABC transporter substrate-binding protein [Thiotrichales bacterium]|tara:strand:+ start:411 stop:1502 length:1092 start_codon:yes stop_codon:yes gene_type:complete
MHKTSSNLNRRDFLKTTTVAASTLAVGTYLPRTWAQEPMRVSAYGGYFEDSLADYVYPEFTKATGIEIESVSQTGGESWFVSIDTALKAGGKPPTDVTMGGGGSPRRFNHLYQHLDESQIPGISNVPAYLLHRKDDGVLDSVAALAWYSIFVTNTEVYPEAPESWADMWQPKYKDSLGISLDVTGSYMLDVVQKTFYDGTDMMSSKEDITTLMEKLAELKPNVRLWYRDEGQFQSALQQGEIPAGQYYHDVTLLAIADGFPLRSTFPKEGGLIDFGNWGLVRGSDKFAQAHIFMDYCTQPEVQANIANSMGVAPVVAREKLPMTDEEFDLVSSPIEPVVPNYEMYVQNGDWVSATWQAMLAEG